ncbi:MAG: hypothetical protein IKL89_05960 [Clostridia bacterium]|nr:hypothetical protein [Clostridia bacterium]
MKKTICKVEYDTETAEIVAKYTSGAFGDADGYEETLCKTPDGKFFVYVNGGAESVHPEEDIKRIAKNKVDEWIAARGL